MSAHGSDYDDEDIYRGEPPQHPQDQAVEPAPSESSHSSTSSSSSSRAGGRIGAIAAKLELAISRWSKNVRGNSSTSSSSSSSSSSSRSSVVTLTKSQLARRRRRRSSVSSLRTMQSERDIAARITRMKALQESRQIPRQFALYLPPSIAPAFQQPATIHFGLDSEPKKGERDRRITWSTSLPLILGQLDLAMRKSDRNRRTRERNKSRGPADDLSFPHHSQIPTIKSPSAARRGRKGKHREQMHPKPATILEEPQVKRQAWFLDVANPTWADLRAIGRLLHIHPLTLEDILQQDPREKLELFTRLGYYFISFRAIESQETRAKIQREAGLTDASGNHLGLDEGSVGEANVYLTVFNDGICCFHYTDVSEHTDRVRNRIMLLEGVMNMSSDWIAHGFLDSIVDSFFPFLEEIEKEVMAIDNIVYSGNTNQVLPEAPPIDLVKGSPVSAIFDEELKAEKTNSSESTAVPRFSEQYTPAEKLRESYRHRPRFAAPRLTIPLLFRRAKRYVGGLWKGYWTRAEPAPSATQLTLRRMARTRKLVTVLGRLLATKSDVVTQIRKRLMRTAVSGGNEANSQTAEELEIAIYMGDVQDHILTLQHSLAHYERMLSQSHPIYLSQLRTTFEMTKGGTDVNLLYLTMISIAVLCLQTLTGSFSLNINVPHNTLEPWGKYTVFSVILGLASMIVVVFVSVVRYWWKKAKRRHIAPL